MTIQYDRVVPQPGSKIGEYTVTAVEANLVSEQHNYWKEIEIELDHKVWVPLDWVNSYIRRVV